MSKLERNDVVQFNENHKWCGALGIVSEMALERIGVAELGYE